MNAPVPLAARSQGQAINRVDGRLKVMGAARYPAEFAPDGCAHAFLVTSRIAHGRITGIDSAAAERAPGVLALLTHLNAPKLKAPPKGEKSDGIRIEERLPLSDDRIHYGGQYVAVVVARTFEEARAAAGMVKVSYAEEKPVLRKADALERVERPKEHQGEKLQVTKGQPGEVLKTPGLVVVEQSYRTPIETHNPMECSATVAVWDGPDQLMVYDATQFVKGAQAIVAHVFELKRENVRVVCPFVGGAFGCKGPVWPHTLLAAMAARVVQRPVRLELTRQQMFTGSGHRNETEQVITMAATAEGKIQAVRQQVEMSTSTVGHWVETCGVGGANVLYDAPAIEFTHAIYPVNLPQPSFMRAPGECPGTYAMECAVDELSYALGMDPVALRLANISGRHPIKGIPWSTHHLRECLTLGAEKFGWVRRPLKPGEMRDGPLLVGWGVATATYPARKWAAEVHIDLSLEGGAIVRTAAHDLGTGAYTVFTQIAADAIGLPVQRVKVEIGRSDFPYGPVAGGSNTTATVGSAIVAAAKVLHGKLAEVAVRQPESPLHGKKAGDLRLVAPGRIGPDESVSDSFAEILRRAGLRSVEAQGGIKEDEDEKTGFQSFGAQFCEVKIDPDWPRVRVTRFVSVMDCGRVINPKTGGSQILGGVVMGIGMALEEETLHDPVTGLPVVRNLADYHVPVNADIPPIEVYFAGEPDFAFNPMGARGMGEIGITGAAAAVANAVFHATGKRIRDLPITLDKLLG